jgi:putative Holliday junction resolvase
MAKIAAIDIGLKRIGIAYSPDGKLVFPQEAVMRKNRDQASRDVKAFLDEYGITRLVVGLPKGGASEEEMRRRIEHFVALLDYDGEVVYQDEYGSSAEAKEMTAGVFRHKKDGKLDSIAAKLILERWLDTRGTGK